MMLYMGICKSNTEVSMREASVVYNVLVSKVVIYACLLFCDEYPPFS